MADQSMTERLPVYGFSIAGFKSFFGPTQCVGPLSKINIIIGENNSGKSNIIRYIRKVLSVAREKQYAIENSDTPRSSSQYNEQQIFGAVRQEDIRQRFDASLPDHLRYLVPWFLAKAFEKSEDEALWVPVHSYDAVAHSSWVSGIAEKFQTSEDKRNVSTLWSPIGNKTGGSFEQHWLPQLLLTITDLARPVFGVELIPAARKIETALETYADELGSPTHEAKQFISGLAHFANPRSENYEADRNRWETLTGFVRKLLRDDKIVLEIPAPQNTIIVKQHNRNLNLEDTGTGVHQAVLLAAKATVTPHPVVCIEEPETHFHPDVQRQLIDYLASSTDKQYFISTHSAHVMDAVPTATVISVRLEQGYSVVNLPFSRHERHEICHRLGYRPSDLMQANALIWIEGPSDRIYLNHWIKAVDPSLTEGWHYSFSLYGGRLLSRFRATDDESAEEFISLLPINRFPFVVIDSDKRKQSDPINKTKRRIVDEVTKLKHGFWITAGREIENYVSWNLRDQAVKTVHSAEELAIKEAKESIWDHPLAYRKDGKIIKENFEKPLIAQRVCEEPADLSVLDLKEKISELVGFIRRANKLS
jgi:predicted ATPase